MTTIGAVLVVRAVQVAVKLGGLRAGRPVAHRLAVLTRPTPARAPEDVAAVVARAASVGRLRPACLPRALTLQAALRRSGRPAELRIGVARGDGGSVLAHAWVELDGRPVGEDPAEAGFEELTPLAP